MGRWGERSVSAEVNEGESGMRMGGALMSELRWSLAAILTMKTKTSPPLPIPLPPQIFASGRPEASSSLAAQQRFGIDGQTAGANRQAYFHI